ncbi:MAG TPA: hypothetical protein VNS55_05580 [Nocardioides sp.]|nr:hypothetical protein [Nocardioides sp.]
MSDLSRRSVLAAGATGLVAGGVLADGGAAHAAPTAAPAARPFTTEGQLYARSRFADRLKRRFSVRGPAGSTTMVLTAVEDLPGAAPGDRHHYRLTFRCSAPGPHQGTFTLERSGFTPTSMFLVPSDEERRHYLAVVNRGH